MSSPPDPGAHAKTRRGAEQEEEEEEKGGGGRTREEMGSLPRTNRGKSVARAGGWRQRDIYRRTDGKGGWRYGECDDKRNVSADERVVGQCRNKRCGGKWKYRKEKLPSLCITAVLGCINYRKKKKKKKKWPQPIVHYPVSPALLLVWYWVRMENVCNPELDQQIQMTQNNCWVSGDRGGRGNDQRIEALWESNRQKFPKSLFVWKCFCHCGICLVCQGQWLSWRPGVCSVFNGQEAVDLAVYM